MAGLDDTGMTSNRRTQVITDIRARKILTDGELAAAIAALPSAPLAVNARTATGYGRCDLCQRPLARDDLIADLVSTGRFAHLTCIATIT
jgi:hypothetical protein